MLRATGLGLLGLLLGLLLAEGLARLILDEHPLVQDLGRLMMAPGPDAELPLLWRRSCAECRPRTNSLGFPGAEPPARSPGTIDVALLGDSMCQGPGLRYEHTLPARLEQELNARQPEGRTARVSCYCIGGHGLVESLAVLRRFVLPRSPDLVLHFLFINDQSRQLFLDAETGKGRHRPAALAPLIGGQAPFRWIPEGARGWLSRHSYLYSEAGTRLSLLLAEHGLFDPVADANLSDSEFTALLGERVAACRAAGVRCAWIIIPRSTHERCRPGPDGRAPEQAVPPCWPDLYQLDRLARWVGELPEPYLDLRQSFLDSPEPLRHADRPYDVDHLGIFGHAYTARQVTNFALELLER